MKTEINNQINADNITYPCLLVYGKSFALATSPSQGMYHDSIGMNWVLETTSCTWTDCGWVPAQPGTTITITA